jgi:hypothetical protein
VKYQGENLLNNQYTLRKVKDMKVKQALSKSGFQWEAGGKMERAKEGKYGQCTL